MTDQDIQFSEQNGWGLVLLNRPKALNSLTMAMCEAFDEKLRQWADDDAIKAVLVEGAGDRAFCAGGDIRWLATTAKEDPAEAATFFRTEYRLNDLIANYPKPYIALIDGVCMGGGVGVSAMADRRVMTSRVLWAMPECGIGLVPDVGASYVLPRLQGGMGMYLALTGSRLSGADCRVAGLATHLVPDDQSSDDVRSALLDARWEGEALATIDNVLTPYDKPSPTPLADSQKAIDQHFGRVESVEALTQKLREEGGGFGEAALERMEGGSPTSMALTVRLLNDAPDTFSACIAREFCVAAHLMEGPDFLEGVRAQIIDKDRNPAWTPARMGEVDPARIDRYFTEPPGGALQLG